MRVKETVVSNARHNNPGDVDVCLDRTRYSGWRSIGSDVGIQGRRNAGMILTVNSRGVCKTAVWTRLFVSNLGQKLRSDGSGGRVSPSQKE